jgi:hypothetical protein
MAGLLLDQEKLKKLAAEFIKENPHPVWGLTYFYFIYVVLGGIHQ